MTRPKDIGTSAESAIVRYAREHGFGGADRLTLSGSQDRGDVRLTAGLTAGVVVESKSGKAAEQASDEQVRAWLDETERERVNAGAAVALLVTKRRGYGPARAGSWWVHVRLRTLLLLFDGVVGPESYLARRLVHDVALRLTLDDALRLLRAVGYGEPLPELAAAVTR